MRKRGVLGAALIAFLIGVQPAGAKDGGAEEFQAALESARKLLAAGKADAGLRLVRKTLTEHEGRDYARAKCADVEDLVRRLAFRVEFPPPDPKTLVAGRLLQYEPTTGRLKIEYDVDLPSDLVEKAGLWIHPARFAGPFSAEIVGMLLPWNLTTRRPAEVSPPVVLVGMEENPKTRRTVTWQIRFGVAPYNVGDNQVWQAAEINLIDGETRTNLAKKETSPVTTTKGFEAEVKVTRSRISASANGKPIGSASKPDDVFGHIAIGGKWTRVVIDGIVEPSWMQSRVDAVVQRDLATFEARFDRREHLPAWLFETPPPRPDGTPTGPPPAGAPDPDVPEAFRDHVAQVEEAFRSEEWAAGLRHVEAMRSNGAPDVLTSRLAARAHFELRDFPAAIQAADRVLALVPAHRETQLLRARALTNLRRTAEATQAFRDAVATHPGDRLVLEAAGLYLLLSGDVAGARATTEEASRRAVRSPALEVIGRTVVKAERGPAFARTFEVRSTNYHVVSDIDAETCREAAALLEEALTGYRTHVGWVKRDTTQLFKVYLFAGQAGFAKYIEDLGGLLGKPMEHAAGLYSPLLTQLLIWNLPTRDEMMETVRHEGFHQYLDRLLPDAPVWFNEGLAVYFERIEKPGGSLRYGIVHHERLELLKKDGVIPVAKLLAQGSGAFYRGGLHSYAQAWLLVHLLRHGKAFHRDLFRGLMDRLETETPHAAVRAVFTDAVCEALDRDLAKHLDELASR